MTLTDTAQLLNILQAHGQRFLDSFNPHEAMGNKRKVAGVTDKAHRSTKQARIESDCSQSSSVDCSHSAEEWTGFGSDAQIEDVSESRSSTQELTRLKASTFAPKLDVVVFSGPVLRSSEPSSTRAQTKTFMSSKVSKLRDQAQEQIKNSTINPDEEDENELTNAQNDALLHRLVHTQLLSGSLNPELNLTSAQRKKALEGRLGQGEKIVRAKERDKASKRVREGILEKQKEKREKFVQEAKDMGNYHPAFKAESREGVTDGIGSYGGGVLKLSKQEIETVQGGPAGGQMRGRRHKR
ncbi:hypothetical protein B0F90DRAFT_1807964 [Multifurca ochricompacta]|uniref:Uncharacterized protein n=1 Tax=Multifurca ochricompacta TaxID=376703 RepID=A0AAD4MDW8_9AGAM|nr:hypothetical protein B0F90DRAFT_1807964 [Multifurca ochricompacta]